MKKYLYILFFKSFINLFMLYIHIPNFIKANNILYDDIFIKRIDFKFNHGKIHYFLIQKGTKKFIFFIKGMLFISKL